MKLAKPQFYFVKWNQLQTKKTLWNSKKRTQKILIEIDKFQFFKGSAKKGIDLRRRLEKNMLACGEYIHCEKDLKKQFKISANSIQKTWKKRGLRTSNRGLTTLRSYLLFSLRSEKAQMRNRIHTLRKRLKKTIRDFCKLYSKNMKKTRFKNK